ncbi:MAG: hypothetical protein ABJG88_04715 [Litorimonas sp.]
MSEDKPDNIPAQDGAKTPIVKTVGGAALEHGKKAVEIVDKASTVAEGASNAFGAIKWVSIALVTIIFAGGAYGVYKVVSAPVKAVGDATEAVAEKVKSGAEKIKDSSAEVTGRLIIPSTQKKSLNQNAETAFTALSNMMSSNPEKVKDRLFRAKNFHGNDGRVCTFNLNFGNGELGVTIAADNEAYASSKALGSNNNRMMRMIIEAGKDDLALSVIWDAQSQNWLLKWKATTLKKTVDDNVAENRALDVLKEASKTCK